MQTCEQVQYFIEGLAQSITYCKTDGHLKTSAVGWIKELEELKTILEKKLNGEFVDFNQPVIIDERESSMKTSKSGIYETSYLNISLRFKTPLLKYLLDSGARPNDRSIHVLVRCKNDENLEEVKEKFALLNEYHVNFNAKNESYHTPLYVAEFNRKKGIADLLKRFGAHKTSGEKVGLPFNRFFMKDIEWHNNTIPSHPDDILSLYANKQR